MDDSWIIHRYPWITSICMKNLRSSLCVFGGCPRRSFLPESYFPWDVQTSNTEQEWTRKRCAPGNDSDSSKYVINFSSTSVNDPSMKKHMRGKSMDIYGQANVGGWVSISRIGCGVSLSQEGGVGSWVGV